MKTNALLSHIFKPKFFMKKIILSSTLASLFLIASAFMASPPIITDDHKQYTETSTITNSCNGEIIELTEVITEDRHSVINDNRSNLTYHNTIDITGVGDQGNTYHGTQNLNGNNNTYLQNGAFTSASNTLLTLVSKGGVPNIIQSIKFITTITPNGVITVNKQTESSKCSF
jgi:hypothetical protein